MLVEEGKVHLDDSGLHVHCSRLNIVLHDYAFHCVLVWPIRAGLPQ
jgi:hypothetical protein